MKKIMRGCFTAVFLLALFGTPAGVYAENIEAKLSSTNGSDAFQVQNSSGTALMHVGSDGNIGIGTTSPGSYKLNVNGNVNATAYYGNGANLTGITVGDGTVSQAKLKTATGEVSCSTPNANMNLTLPGGQYGFYPQVKTTGDIGGTATIGGMMNFYSSFYFTNSSYVTNIMLNVANSGTTYAQQRYVTASGEDMQIFLLLDKIAKEILAAYQAPDHPAYGNGGNFDKVPHPFGNYNSDTQEIILLDIVQEIAYGVLE